MTSVSPDLAGAKRALRAELLARREALSNREAVSAAIVASLLPLLGPARVVSLYWPIGSEVDPRGLFAPLAARGIVTALPRIAGRAQPLVFHRWAPGDPLRAGRFGTSEPDPAAAPVMPDHLVVPLLGFDRAGYRLGYGGGFYDRTLARLRAAGRPVAIGVAFARQEVDRVPCGRYDQPLDAIVTEQGPLPRGTVPG